MFCVYMRVCVCAHTFWLFFTEAPICLMQAGRITILIACGCSGGVNAIHRCVCVVVGNAIASLAGVNGEPGRLGGGGLVNCQRPACVAADSAANVQSCERNLLIALSVALALASCRALAFRSGLSSSPDVACLKSCRWRLAPGC